MTRPHSALLKAQNRLDTETIPYAFLSLIIEGVAMTMVFACVFVWLAIYATR